MALPDTTVRTTFSTKSYIADGYVADTLLEIPAVTASPTKTLTSPITASNLPSGAALRLSLFNDAGDQTGLVVGPPNVSSITPPKLVGAAATAVGKIATAGPVFVTELDDELDYFFRNSTGPSFDVK